MATPNPEDNAVQKRCSKCEQVKDVGEFGTRNNSKDGMTGQCKSCLNGKHQKHRDGNREEVRKSSREWGRRNKKHLKDYAHKNRFMVAIVKSRHHAKKFGHAMCSATIGELEAAYTGKCDICSVPELELTHKLCMDHDHETGEFRGFLCGKCNKMLGLAGDSEAVLIDALHYLMSRAKNERNMTK